MRFMTASGWRRESHCMTFRVFMEASDSTNSPGMMRVSLPVSSLL